MYDLFPITTHLASTTSPEPRRTFVPRSGKRDRMKRLPDFVRHFLEGDDWTQQVSRNCVRTVDALIRSPNFPKRVSILSIVNVAYIRGAGHLKRDLLIFDATS